MARASSASTPNGSGAASDSAAEPSPEELRAALEVFAQLELRGLLDSVVHRVAAWTGATMGIGLGLGEESRNFLPLAGTVPRDDLRFRAFAAVAPDALTRWIDGRPQVFSGWGPFAEMVGDRWTFDGPTYVGAFPVTSTRGSSAGACLLLYDEAPSAEIVARVESFLRSVGPAVDNALQVLSMRELIIKDDTACCFNRRHFEESLPEELARSNRFRTPVSLIFLDMDNLKSVNNQHGHSMGSRTLFEVSVRVRSKIRKFDKLFRFGGDEFCIVLPATEWHGALEVAERVRDAISAEPFLMNEVDDGEGIPMSASFGIASFPLHARTQRQLVQQADRAMQKIKREGKNAIGVSSSSDEDHD